MLAAFNRMILGLYAFRRPTVAAVNGHAIAGGMVLMLCCDTRIGPREYGRYGLTEGRVGVAFPVGGFVPPFYELRREISRRWMLTADTYPPEEALAAGAFSELTPADRVLERARAVASEHLQLPESYGRIKHQVRAEGVERLRNAVRDGDPYQGRWLSEDVPARIEALLAGD